MSDARLLKKEADEDLFVAVGFPIVWDFGVQHADTLYIQVAAHKDDQYQHGWEFSLRLSEIVSDMIDSCCTPTDGKIRGAHVPAAERLSALLREQADRLDGAIERRADGVDLAGEGKRSKSKCEERGGCFGGDCCLK